MKYCVVRNCGKVADWVQPLTSQKVLDYTKTYQYQKLLEEAPPYAKKYMNRENLWYACDEHLEYIREDIEILNPVDELRDAYHYIIYH